MDDTTRRVDRSGEFAGRAAEDITGRSSESTAGYSGTAESPATDAPAGDAGERTTEIRRDIEQTRDEMSETIDAIQEKLRPASIVSSATQRVKDATTERVRNMTQSAGEAANRMMYGTGGRQEGIMGGIRENPIPAALIGLGAAWWYMNSRGSSRRERDWRYGTTSRSGQSPERHLPPSYRTGAEREELVDEDREFDAGFARGYAGAPDVSRRYGAPEGEGLVDRLKHNPVPAALTGVGLAWLAMSGRSGREWEPGYEGARGWRQSEADESSTSGVAERVSGMAESARHMTSGAQEYGRDAAERVRHHGRRAQTGLERLARENPLAVGAGALLLGAAVGLVIPETERENEWMGEARDTMVDRAQEMAEKAASTAQDTAADLAGEAASRIVKGATE